MLVRPGHQISEEIGIVDVTPYANIDSMMTEQQWAETIDALERAGGRKLFVEQETLFQEHIDGWRNAAQARCRLEGARAIGFVKGRPPEARGGHGDRAWSLVGESPISGRAVGDVSHLRTRRMRSPRASQRGSLRSPARS